MFGRIINILRYPTYTRTLSLLALFIVIAAIPLTVFVAQQQQETRQRAAESITKCECIGGVLSGLNCGKDEAGKSYAGQKCVGCLDQTTYDQCGTQRFCGEVNLGSNYQNLKLKVTKTKCAIDDPNSIKPKEIITYDCKILEKCQTGCNTTANQCNTSPPPAGDTNPPPKTNQTTCSPTQDPYLQCGTFRQCGDRDLGPNYQNMQVRVTEEKCTDGSLKYTCADVKTCEKGCNTSLSKCNEDVVPPPGGAGQCSAKNVPKAPTGYKWVPVNSCKKSCTDTTYHKDCDVNDKLPSDLISKSAWCYGYQNAQGKEEPKCLQLRRAGTGTPTPSAPPGSKNLTCTENTDPNLKTSKKLALNVKFTGDKTVYDKIVCIKAGKPEQVPIGINDPLCVFKNLNPNTEYLLKAAAVSSKDSSKPQIECAGKTYKTLAGPGGPTPTEPPGGGKFNTSPCYIQLTKPQIAASAPLSPWRNNLKTLTWIEAAPNRAHNGFQWDKFWGKYQASRAGWNYGMAGIRVQGAQGKGTIQDLDWFANQMFGIFGITNWTQLQAHEKQIGCPFLEIKEACNGNGATAKGKCPANASSQTCSVQPNTIDSMKPASFTCTPPGKIKPSITPRPTRRPTGSITPTGSIKPTKTPTPTNTTFSFTVALEGIGRNFSIMTPERELKVWATDIDNNQIEEKVGTIVYDSNSGEFKGEVDMGNTLTKLRYLIRVKTDRYLASHILFGQDGKVIRIKPGETNQIPKIKLRAGDIQDLNESYNQLDILDWNVLRNCGYLDPSPLPMDDPDSAFNSEPCVSIGDERIRSNADLNDDGTIDLSDFDLFDENLNNSKGE